VCVSYSLSFIESLKATKTITLSRGRAPKEEEERRKQEEHSLLAERIA
jgi:hypothetical protein